MCGNCSGRGRECVRSKRPHLLHRTLPGERFERRHVLVSVVQQLKHLLRTRSLSFVAASSVCTTWMTPPGPAPGGPCCGCGGPCGGAMGALRIVPGMGYETKLACGMGKPCAGCA